ncbi:hypothetical protein ACUSIJ_24750 [Pseudochelatococcus sp. B33]
MTDKPILFSAPMVRALIDGRKTMTRRVLKPQPSRRDFRNVSPETARWFHDPVRGGMWISDGCAVGPFKSFSPGDRLWVREAFSYDSLDVDRDGLLPPWYWADGNPTGGDYTKPRPSIHMPRWASRLTLIVTGVRVERLQDISEEDAIAEGVLCDSDGWRDYLMPQTQCCPTAKDSFRTLWNSINGPGAWEANPWVSVTSFDVHRQNIDQMEAA